MDCFSHISVVFSVYVCIQVFSFIWLVFILVTLSQFQLHFVVVVVSGML